MQTQPGGTDEHHQRSRADRARRLAGFSGGRWRDEVDVAGFVRANITPHEGDGGFLVGPTERTTHVWGLLTGMFPQERERGIYDVDARTPASITAHRPGYIDRDRELIVGLQTDAPLRRAIMPSGGLRMVENGLRAYGYELDPVVWDHAATPDAVCDREELAEQPRALDELKTMAAGYGYDISKPARTARDAIQWLYFGYLAAAKEQNGAAMSLGRTSSFLDVYLERDLAEGRLDERGAQELVDDFVIKLRIIRFLRTPEYDQLFSGDPTWVTEAIGGMGRDGRTLVTRTSYRYLQTLYNLGPAPEPNLTVLWSPALPEPFKRFCAKVNGGRDEISGAQVAPATPPVAGDVLDHDTVLAAFDRTLDWLARTYVDALNVIHYMHGAEGLAGFVALLVKQTRR